jgi:hypothetical protein
MAVLETEVVGTAEGQLTLQSATLVGILGAADLGNQLADLGRTSGLEIGVEANLENL